MDTAGPVQSKIIILTVQGPFEPSMVPLGREPDSGLACTAGEDFLVPLQARKDLDSITGCFVPLAIIMCLPNRLKMRESLKENSSYFLRDMSNKFVRAGFFKLVSLHPNAPGVLAPYRHSAEECHMISLSHLFHRFGPSC